MDNKYILFVLLVLVSLPLSLADDGPVTAPAGAVVAQPQGQAVVQAQVDAANRFLSAEVAKQIKAANAETLQSLKDYQDENFRELDGRMQVLAEDMRQKLILGGIGSMMLASGIVALVYMWAARKYSYETYQKNVIDKLQHEATGREATPAGLQQMQQEQWQFQENPGNVSAQLGIDQAQASEMTQLNEWQHQPVYQGGWKPPEPHNDPMYDPRAKDAPQQPQWTPGR